MEAAGGCTVYTSNFGTFTVSSRRAVVFERAGGTGSWLGFPIGDKIDECGLYGGKHWANRQQFECGDILRHRNHHTVTVSTVVMDALEAQPGLREQIGYPISEESSTGIDGVIVQLFTDGVITITDNEPTVWVRS